MASMLHSVTQEHPQPTPAIIFLRFKVLFATGYFSWIIIFGVLVPLSPYDPDSDLLFFFILLVRQVYPLTPISYQALPRPPVRA